LGVAPVNANSRTLRSQARSLDSVSFGKILPGGKLQISVASSNIDVEEDENQKKQPKQVD